MNKFLVNWRYRLLKLYLYLFKYTCININSIYMCIYKYMFTQSVFFNRDKLKHNSKKTICIVIMFVDNTIYMFIHMYISCLEEYISRYIYIYFIFQTIFETYNLTYICIGNFSLVYQKLLKLAHLVSKLV